MKRFTIVVVALTALFASTLFAQHGEGSKGHVMLNAQGLKWGPAPPGLPKGAKIAVLSGDPTKPGYFTFRAKMPAGYTIRPHWHSNDEHVTVLEGTFNMGLGEKLDKKMARSLSVGGYAVMPKGVRHFAIAGGKGALIQVQAMGPFDINYVNPADDPRKGGGR
jgi:quercetin dioxygenase-like cupin family protein